jgi:sugar diacid utilization regulator
VALRHAGNTSVIVFVEEHSLRVLAVYLAKSWRKYHLSDVVGKCTDQSVGHQLHHTTYKKGVYYQENKIYNHLPKDIKDLSNNMNKFKLALRRYLSDNSFYSLKEYFGT